VKPGAARFFRNSKNPGIVRGFFVYHEFRESDAHALESCIALASQRIGKKPEGKSVSGNKLGMQK